MIQLILLLFPFLLCAGVEHHLKKAENKSGSHSIRNIDFIYMINLDQRSEKWKLSIDQLAPYDIDPYRFSAVNGWELTLEEINDVGVKFSSGMAGGFWGTSYPLSGNYEPSHEIIKNDRQTYFCHCMARGTIGCILSHLSVLQDAYDSGYQTIWIMEDDIFVLRDPRIISDLIDRLDRAIGKGNWDILFTDREIRDAKGHYVTSHWGSRRPNFTLPSYDFSMRKEITPEFRQVAARLGSHSMILRRSGIEKFLQFFKTYQIFLPYDLDYIMPPGIKLFTVLNDVVSNLPNAPSDNGGPFYLSK